MSNNAWLTKFMAHFAFLFILLTPLQSFAADCVVLLHGLAKPSKSMAPLSDALTSQGYITVNVNYPSRHQPIEKLAIDTIDKAIKLCPEGKRINFVTHSMGGILVRYYLHKNKLNTGRTVMLGPPNKGSEVVDKLHTLPGFELLNGPAGMHLGTHKKSIPNKLGPIKHELGIIAGNHSINPILSSIIPGPDDGKVSVESTKLKGMSVHITLPVTHTFMMSNSTVITQALYFLKHGSFITKDISHT